MKKAFLIIAAAMLISTDGNCQWYHRQYGVNNINQLSQEQLNDALIKAKGGVFVGAFMSIVSVIGIVSGISIYKSSAPYATRESQAYEGVLLAIVSVPLGLAGVTTWGIHGTRVNTIKGIMKNTEIKIGLFNYPTGFVGSHASASAGCSMVFRF